MNRIIAHIMQCVSQSDFNALQGFWTDVNKRLFSRLTHESLNMAYRLETNLLKLFLIQATKQGKHDEVKTFFEKMSDSLHDRKEWRDWFGELKLCGVFFASPI